MPWALDYDTYRAKVYGGWLGKNIGGTLGGPVEGHKQLLDLTFYPKLSESGPMPNDDLDLQLVWLHALEQHSPRLLSSHLAQEWVEHVFFPFDEYGYALYNLRRGLAPPVSGWFGNPFTDCMGSPIRSEIWAMIAPGIPDLACYYAFQDAIVDHAGGEGVWGELFFAAIESAAFIISDRSQLIDIGLNAIPAQCRVSMAVRDLLSWHAQGMEWQEARNAILSAHGNSNFTDAPQNIAFTILGWLYGTDFGDAILKAVNCGYDTDCTGATLGAILGIIGGSASLPERWVAPVGNRIVVSRLIYNLDAPTNLEELTERTYQIAREVLIYNHVPLEIKRPDPSTLPLQTLLPMPGIDILSLHQYNHAETKILLPSALDRHKGLQVSVKHIPESPVLFPQTPHKMQITLQNCRTDKWIGTMTLEVPSGWSVDTCEPLSLDPGEVWTWQPVVIPNNHVNAINRIQLVVSTQYDPGKVWATEYIPICLVAGLVWFLPTPEGKLTQTFAPDNVIPFQTNLGVKEPGIFEAHTTVYSREDQIVNLIVATESPLEAELNGAIILMDNKPRAFMPAYHRPRPGTCAGMTLHAGANPLRVKVSSENCPHVMVAFVNPTKGLTHACLDLLVGFNPEAKGYDDNSSSAK